VKIYRAAVADGASEGCGVVTQERRRLFVGCGAGRLEILELQPSGKRRMMAADFLNGNPKLERAF